MNEAARAAAKTSTARALSPPRSHAVMRDAYDACGRSVRTPLARVLSDAVLASRLAAESAASAASFASNAAVFPKRIAAAVSTGGGASFACASFASACFTTAFAAASASSSRRDESVTPAVTPMTSSICRKLPTDSHAETHEAAVDAPGVWSGRVSRISRHIAAASPACALPGAAHACIAAAYSAGSGSTALHPARYVAIASSSRPPSRTRR